MYSADNISGNFTGSPVRYRTTGDHGSEPI